MDENSLSHMKRKCQYHVIVIPKRRIKAIYGKLRKDIGEMLRRLCEYKHVEIIEAHAMPDHIHMLVSILPKLSVSDFMATAVKRGSSYKISASCGYDISGKQLRKHFAWTPPPGMTPKQEDAQREACGDFWKDTDGRVFTHDDGAPVFRGGAGGQSHDRGIPREPLINSPSL